MLDIKNTTYSSERALYALCDAVLSNCRFQGEEDGESPLKEAKNIALVSSFCDLRYPFWHDDGITLRDVSLTENCRAALWYSRDVRVEDSRLHGIKALRECENVQILGSDIRSAEFGWHCRHGEVKDSVLHGEYAFFGARDLTLSNVQFSGKYSFQYCENLIIENCVLETKDAFWNAKNVVVRDSVIKGEYLAWYAENITFVRCRILGTQPLCYCKGLRLVDCSMEDCDLSFEYSEVEADIHGHVDSVKNPSKGRIVADSYGEILFTDDAVYPTKATVIVR